MNLSQNFQNMNKKLFLMPALLLGALLMFAPGCGEDDPCKDVACGNGVCIDGSCDCDAGYELGASGECDTEMRTKFIGAYNTSETCNGMPFGNYSNNISTSGSDVTKIIISNFGDSGQNAVATVDGTDVTLDPITLGGFAVTGSGTINGNVLTFNYSFSTFSCVMTMTKI
jgi:hypothetical protein